MTTSVLGVIPARLGSTRLPRKPLHLLAGRPLVEWVWRRVQQSSLFDAVVIATDSEEIASAARSFGAAAVLTLGTHPSGTDRVAEVAARPEFRGYRTIVNIQGDEPLVRADHLRAAIAAVTEGGWEVGTVAYPLATDEEWHDPAVVKVVRGDDGGALYFSRAPIPWKRDGGALSGADVASGDYLRHVGIYAYTSSALARWVTLPEGRLERLEKLEQLRPLAGGIRIGVSLVDAAEGGVDTLDDARRAERRLLELAAAAASAEGP